MRETTLKTTLRKSIFWGDFLSTVSAEAWNQQLKTIAWNFIFLICFSGLVFVKLIITLEMMESKKWWHAKVSKHSSKPSLTNTTDKSDKKALYVIFGNIHNIMSLKRTTLLFKISYGKNLYLRYSSVNIFQTRPIMT